jgi:toxin-antitoxin system PIN domain toxin
VRILTHPKVFRPPDTRDQAFAFVRSLLGHPNALLLNPGRDHVRLFEELCGSADARGDLATDAYLAALAVETGAELVSADRDFALFPGLRWRRPQRSDASSPAPPLAAVGLSGSVATL